MVAKQTGSQTLSKDEDAMVPDPVDFVQERAFKAFVRYIGFTPAAVKQIFARGLSSMDSLQGQEKNQVESMCKCIERGMTGTPGIPFLNSDSIKWLKLGTYAIKRRQYCGWQTTTMDFTKTELRKWSNFKRSEEDYKEPTDPPSNDGKTGSSRIGARPLRSLIDTLETCEAMIRRSLWELSSER
jgi:hypothetical protein